jgi:DNA anti-recombination protein RmuC
MDDQTLGQKIDAAVEKATKRLNARVDELQTVVSELMDRVDALQGQGGQAPDPVQPPDDSAEDAPHVEHH